VQVWAAPDTGWNRTNVWAPELQLIDGRWYIYYAAGRTNPGEFFTTQRSGVLEAETADPQGRWVDRGQLYTGDDVAGRTNNRWAIDLTVERIGGQLYAFWSGWEGDAPNDKTQNQNLYAARMANPYTIATNRVRVSAPDQPWEDNPADVGFDLQEGPAVLRNAGQIFVIYSTRESWLPNYRLGLLRLTDSTRVLEPASYTKSGPIFVSGQRRLRARPQRVHHVARRPRAVDRLPREDEHLARLGRPRRADAALRLERRRLAQPRPPGRLGSAAPGAVGRAVHAVIGRRRKAAEGGGRRRARGGGVRGARRRPRPVGRGHRAGRPDLHESAVRRRLPRPDRDPRGQRRLLRLRHADRARARGRHP
jgi:hypothetical protein